MREYQAFPHMPSTKDGKPFLDAAGQPVVLHSEDEEKEFRSNNGDVVADRPAPPTVAAQPTTLVEALAVIEDLKRKLHEAAPDQYPEVAVEQPLPGPDGVPVPVEGQAPLNYQMRYGPDGKLLPDQPGIKPPASAADPVMSKDGTIVDVDAEEAQADAEIAQGNKDKAKADADKAKSKK